jgi:hypothetical protein
VNARADAIAQQPVLRGPQVYVLTGGPTDPPSGFFARTIGQLGDLAFLFVIALALPFVIMGIGLPIALLIRGLLWIAGRF